MKKQYITLLLFISIAGCNKPSTDPEVTLPCLTPGVWGNDWQVCNRGSSPSFQGTLENRLAQELKLILRPDSTGEMSFFFCPIQARIAKPVQFTYQVANGRMKFNWLGNEEEIYQISQTFNKKNSFKASCKKDTLFVDSLMYYTFYRGATYFIRRN